MRRKLPLGHTQQGIALLGISGTLGFALLSAAMHSYRAVFEPLLRLVLPYFDGRRGGYYRYDPSSYEFWAWMPLLLAFVWLVICLIAFVTKPATDRRIDKALRQRLQQSARGAPLEPD